MSAKGHSSADRSSADPHAALVRSGRVFAFTLAGGFTFVALVGLWRGFSSVTDIASALAAAALLAGILVPGRLEPARRGWMKLGEAIGRVTTPVLMAIVYYAVLTPTALLRRLVTRRPQAPDTYWHARPRLPDRSRLERQF